MRVAAGDTAEVAGDPPRLFDPAAAGWYGGDLHVHLNYSGDLVCAPADAARMQAGEGLHLLNLLAANFASSLIYDRDLLERTAGRDLPWSGPGIVARAGVEYRNDLLGHVHALGPAGPPSRYHDRPRARPSIPTTGRRTPSPARNCAGSARPSATPTRSGPSSPPTATRRASSPARARSRPANSSPTRRSAWSTPSTSSRRSTTRARSSSTTGCSRAGCGSRRRPAPTASCRSPGCPSRPTRPAGAASTPTSDGADLSVAAFQDAIRAGRTVVTNGPWLTLSVDGAGPGAVLDRSAGAVLAVRATVTGPGADSVSLVGPDGVLASSEVTGKRRCGPRGPDARRPDLDRRGRARRRPPGRAGQQRARAHVAGVRRRRRCPGRPRAPTPAGASACSTRSSRSWPSTATSRRPPGRSAWRTCARCWSGRGSSTGPRYDRRALISAGRAPSRTSPPRGNRIPRMYHGRGQGAEDREPRVVGVERVQERAGTGQRDERRQQEGATGVGERPGRPARGDQGQCREREQERRTRQRGDDPDPQRRRVAVDVGDERHRHPGRDRPRERDPEYERRARAGPACGGVHQPPIVRSRSST